MEDWAELFQNSGRAALQVLDDHGKVFQHVLEAGQGVSAGYRAATIGVGAAGMVLGASELYQGARSLRRGEKLHGALSLAGGTSAILGASANLAQGLAPTLYHAYPWARWSAEAAGVGAICDGIEDLLPDRRAGATPLLGAAKLLSGGLLIGSGLLANATLQTVGSTLYVGILYGQYKNVVDEWLKDRFNHGS
ncbi:MAG: hypothetical protein KF760_06020 [Candidatus Eremiobacteraeota bacterium]|nr:hypothetical protein [Candidatus Eremiobacteraeota bacterium]MCW5867049.1 hypothetical protein [Candidatus Eremiobacteraeota bacterium]